MHDGDLLRTRADAWLKAFNFVHGEDKATPKISFQCAPSSLVSIACLPRPERKRKHMKQFMEHLTDLESTLDSDILREQTSLRVARAKMWDKPIQWQGADESHAPEAEGSLCRNGDVGRLHDLQECPTQCLRRGHGR